MNQERRSEWTTSSAGAYDGLPAPRAVPAALLALIPLIALIGLAGSACGLPPIGGQEEESEEMPHRSIEEVQEERTPEWMKLPGVVGTGIGACENATPCIRVFLAAPSPEAQEAIPGRVEGYRVELVVTGRFEPRVPADTGAPDEPEPEG